MTNGPAIHGAAAEVERLDTTTVESTDLDVHTPVDRLSEAQARALTSTIQADLGSLAANLAAAYKGRAWEALGYASWSDYTAAEFTLDRWALPPGADRETVVHTLRDAGMSLREIEAATSLSKSTVGRMLTPPAVPDGTPRQPQSWDDVYPEPVTGELLTTTAAMLLLMSGRSLPPPQWWEPVEPTAVHPAHSNRLVIFHAQVNAAAADVIDDYESGQEPGETLPAWLDRTYGSLAQMLRADQGQATPEQLRTIVCEFDAVVTRRDAARQAVSDALEELLDDLDGGAGSVYVDTETPKGRLSAYRGQLARVRNQLRDLNELGMDDAYDELYEALSTAESHIEERIYELQYEVAMADE